MVDLTLQFLVASFKYLDLPVNPETGACSTDYIEVGPVGTEQFVCGQHVQHYTSPVTDQQVTLKFFTGNTQSPRGHGFELSYFIGMSSVRLFTLVMVYVHNE